MPKTSETGFIAEHYAAEFLKSRGYQIIDHNFRRPWGEIDIIAAKDNIIVFAEVKAGKAGVFGFEPELRANKTKMLKVLRTAKTYLISKNFPTEQEWQLDIISVDLDRERGVAKIKHFKNIEL